MRRYIYTVFVVVASLIACTAAAGYTEELHLKPLRSRHTLAHFQFAVSRAKSDITPKHTDLFPKSFDLLARQYAIKEFHLSLTKGGWQYARWGMPPISAPHGAEMTVFFNNASTGSINDQSWKAMTNSLSGLFCASLSFMHNERGQSTSHSQWTIGNFDPAILPFRPQSQEFSPHSSFLSWGDVKHDSRLMRHSILAGETVCTENLTPWIKLLPCRTHAGLGSIFSKPTSLYTVDYHSMGIHYFPARDGGDNLVFTLTLVIDTRKLQEFNLTKLFKATKLEPCPSASSTTVTIHGSTHDEVHTTAFEQGESIQVSIPLPQNSVQATVESLKEIEWIHVSRWLAGWGQQGGQLVMRFQNKLSTPISGIYYHSIPWYLRFYYHTTKAYLNGMSIPLGRDSGQQQIQLKVRPTSDRGLSTIAEFELVLPPNSDLLVASDFERNFIHWTEFPPDAHRGFEVGSGVFSVNATPEVSQALRQLDTDGYVFAVGGEWGVSRLSSAHFLHIYTDTIAIMLPTPDFSMPYNVITMTSTIWVLFFGSIVNALLRRYKDLYAGANEFVDDRPISKIIRKLSSLFTKKQKQL